MHGGWGCGYWVVCAWGSVGYVHGGWGCAWWAGGGVCMVGMGSERIIFKVYSCALYIRTYLRMLLQSTVSIGGNCTHRHSPAISNHCTVAFE